MKTNEELVAAYQAGDNAALTDLWINNQRGVRSIAEKMARKGYGEVEDLIQEGFIGLQTAASRYDPAGGAAFFTYAVHCIRSAIIRAYGKNGPLIRISEGRLLQLFRYRTLLISYNLVNGENPPEAFVRLKLGLSSKDIKELKKVQKLLRTASLDTPAGEDENGATLGDFIVDPDGNNTEEIERAIDFKNMAAELQRMIDELPPKQADLIRRRFWGSGALTKSEYQLSKQVIWKLKRQRYRVEPYYREYLATSEAYSGGLSYFRNHGCSVTEKIAIEKADRARAADKRRALLDDIRAESAAELESLKKGG